MLVVDDDEAIRTLVTRLFQRRGFEAANAVDGADAIDRLDAGSYDLMILDLMMPRIDGVGVLEYLANAQRPAPPVIVMTAAAAGIVSRVPMQHVRAIIAKPFDVEKLMKHAEEALA